MKQRSNEATKATHLPVSRLQDLLREVLIDHGGLKTQPFGRVDVIVGVFPWCGGLEGRLVHRQIIELTGVSLVEKERAVHLNQSDPKHKQQIE